MYSINFFHQKIIILVLLLIIVFPKYSKSQKLNIIDSLKSVLNHTDDDTEKVLLNVEIANTYWNEDLQQMQFYTEKAIQIAEKISDKKFLSIAYHTYANYFGFVFKIDSAINYDLKSLELYKSHHNVFQLWSGLNGYASDLSLKGEYNYALKIYDSAIGIAKKYTFTKPTTKSYLGAGNVCYMIGQLDKAEDYYSLGMDIALLNSDSLEFYELVANYASLKILSGHVNDTLIKLLNESLEYSVRDGNQIKIATIQSTLASALSVQKLFDEAIQIYKKSVILFIKLKDFNQLAVNYSNIAENYFLINQMDSASFYADSAIIYSEKIEFQTGVILGKAIKANQLIERGKYTQAFALLENSSKKSEEIGDFYSLNYIYLLLGKYYIATNNIDKAISSLKQCETLSINVKNKYLLAQAYKYLYLASKKSGKVNDALKYYEYFTLQDDSLRSDQVKAQIIDLNVKYQTKENEFKIKLINKEKLALKNKNLFLTVLIVILIVSFVIFVGLFYKTRIQKKKISKAKLELEILNGILKHETVRQFTDIFISLNNLNKRDQKIKEISTLKIKVTSILSLYSVLFSSENKDKLSLKKIIENIYYEHCKNVSIDTKLVIEGDAYINLKNSESFSMAFNELMANSFHHGFTNQTKTPQIRILIIESSEQIKIEYFDNGIGYLEDNKFIPGKGRYYIKSIFELSLKGTFEKVKSNHGVHFSIKID